MTLSLTKPGSVPFDRAPDERAVANRVIDAITAFEQNYASSYRTLPFDPTHLAETVIADPAVSAAVLLAWHEMREPETSDMLAFDAETDFRFANIGLDFKTSSLGREPNAENRTQPPRQPVKQIWNRLSAETINLADHEVLEAILAPVIGQANTFRVTHALLAEFGAFGRVIHAAAADLLAIEGLGEAGVTALKTVGAAALYMLRKAIDNAPRIRMWDDLTKYVIARLQHERVEVFFCIFLDSASRVLADEELNRGTINRVAGHPREIIRRCMALDAAAIILVHNHPTGKLQPSIDDMGFTEDVVRAATALGITVSDHLIVGNGECFSFRANKLL